MPIFACRWPDGNISFVAAANREQAEYQLDELGDASGIKLVKVPEFMVHMHLSDTGRFEFAYFGEVAESFINDLYPILGAVMSDEKGNPSAEEIRAAVEAERDRVVPRSRGRKPRTEVGKELQKLLDMPTSMVDRIVEQVGANALATIPVKGKKH